MPNVFRRSFVIAALCAWVGVWGCAGGEEIAPVGECESNLDCGANQFCDLATNTCESLRPANNSSNSMPTNVGPGDTGFNPGNNSDSDAGTTDMAPEVCEPECASDETCMAGTCVSACPTGCPNDQICSSEGCVYPDCAAAGDPCNPDQGDQGEFLCLQDEMGNGTCFDSCDDSLTQSTCGVGEFCFDVSEDGMFKACFESNCASSADCTDGTCVDFQNEFSTCVGSGAIAIGAACNIESGDGCVGGAFCRRTDVATGDGVCSAVCDPWAATSNCPAGEACGYFFTWRTGLCTDNLDALGSEPYEQCATPGAACADATRCFSVDATTNGCFPYCRPGENDCIGILPNGTDASCNNYAFYGNRDIGICFAPCSADGDCGATGRCVSSVCRTSCTTATLAADCCNGTTPCDAQCVNGLCE